MNKIGLPKREAKMREARMSITALEIKILLSPLIPSLKAPKIFVPLAQKVMVTII